MEKNNQKNTSKKKLIKIAIIAIVISVLAYCAFWSVSNYADIARDKAVLSQKQEQLAKEKENNEKIKSILDSDDKDEYIEEKAREKGYVKDGEVVYYDISDSK